MLHLIFSVLKLSPLRPDWWYANIIDNKNYPHPHIEKKQYSDKILRIRQKNLNQDKWQISSKK